MVLFYHFLKDVLYGARNKCGIVIICDILIRKLIPKHIDTGINGNKIACGCETCISDMLIQSGLI